jgi:hypothetical protein
MAGRPTGRKRITEHLIPIETIRNIRYTLQDIYSGMENQEKSIIWLASHHLLRNEYFCEKCHNLCTFSVYNQGGDGYRWSCASCRFSKSLRDSSFFSKSKLTLKQILLVMYMWSCEYSSKIIKRETGIFDEAVTDWRNFMRDVTMKWLDEFAEPLGGFNENGDPIIIEVDESAFGK